MKEQIKYLALTYIRTRDEAIFNELYRLLDSTVWSQTRRRDAWFARTTENDVQSVYHETLWRVIERYDETKGDIYNMIIFCTRNAIKDLRRASNRRYWLEMYEEAKEDDAATSFDFADERMNVEDDALKDIRKREQRQLLSSLVASAKDDLTSRIVEKFAQYDSYHALGKALGNVRGERVKGKIERLARFYDAKRFGDVSDYLAI